MIWSDLLKMVLTAASILALIWVVLPRLGVPT
jgi:hypothetical protein